MVTNSGKDAGNAVVTIQSLDPDTLQFGNEMTRTFRLAPGASSVQLYDADGRMRATIAAFDSGEPIVQLYDVTASVTKSL